MKIGPFIFFRSKEGDIGPGRSWVCFYQMWMYNAETFPGLLLDMWRNWKNDNSLVG